MGVPVGLHVKGTFLLQGHQARSRDPNAHLIHIIRLVWSFRKDDYFADSCWGDDRYALYVSWWCGNMSGSVGLIVDPESHSPRTGKTYGVCTKCLGGYQGWLRDQIERRERQLQLEGM